jgi:hypothetical protein
VTMNELEKATGNRGDFLPPLDKHERTPDMTECYRVAVRRK